LYSCLVFCKRSSTKEMFGPSPLFSFKEGPTLKSDVVFVRVTEDTRIHDWQTAILPSILSSASFTNMPNARRECLLAVAYYQYFGGPDNFIATDIEEAMEYPIHLTDYMFEHSGCYTGEIARGIRAYKSGDYPNFLNAMCDEAWQYLK